MVSRNGLDNPTVFKGSQARVGALATRLGDSTLRLGNLPNSLSLVSRRTVD